MNVMDTWMCFFFPVTVRSVYNCTRFVYNSNVHGRVKKTKKTQQNRCLRSQPPGRGFVFSIGEKKGDFRYCRYCFRDKTNPFKCVPTRLETTRINTDRFLFYIRVSSGVDGFKIPFFLRTINVIVDSQVVYRPVDLTL